MSNFPDFPMSYIYLAGVGVAVIAAVLVIQICSRNIKDDTAHMIRDDDTIATAIAKFRMSISLSHDTALLLRDLRKKIHKQPSAAKDAMEAGLSTYLLECLKSTEVDNRIPLALDCLNEMWSNAEARVAARTDMDLYKQQIDTFSDICQQLRIANHTDSDVDYDEYEYKCIILIGMMATDNAVAQSYMGDRGAIEYVLAALKNRPENNKIAKWCCWALVNLTFCHPPNKRAVVQRDGLSIVLKAMDACILEEDVVQQGAGLLFNILSNDVYTKMNLPKVRQQAMACGAVDILQSIQQKYRGNKGLMKVCTGVLDLLIVDWS